MKKQTLFTALFLALAFCTVRNTNAQPGTLDITFSSDGKVTTDFGSSLDAGNSVAIQSDGKIVVAGTSYNGSDLDFALVRYNTDGSLDTTFGSSGKVTTAIVSGDDEGYSVRQQADGKIVVAGSSYDGISKSLVLVRYNTDGTLDNNFGTGGKVTPVIVGAGNELGNSVAIQSDGKIVVAGSAYNGSSDDFALLRLLADGTLDNLFGFGGSVTTYFGNYNETASSVVIQSDGKIVVTGYSYNGSDYVFALARYNTNGSSDNTFGSGGKVTTSVGSSDDNGKSVSIQSDGKIVVAGYSYNGSDLDFAVARYNGDGGSGITEESNDGSFNVSIFPNPFTASATVVIATPSTRGKQSQSYTFTMYDLLGREMKLIEITGNKIEINRGNLPSGMYFYKLTNKQKILATGKIIIE